MSKMKLESIDFGNGECYREFDYLEPEQESFEEVLELCNKDFLLTDLPPTEYVVQRLDLAKDSLSTLVAAGGVGKSWISQYLMICVATGTPLFEKFSVVKGKVLHVDQEQNIHITKKRYGRICNQLKIDQVSIDRVKLKVPIDSKTISETEMIHRLARDFSKYDLVVLDSLKQITECDENSAEIAKPMRVLRTVAERANCCVLVIAHKGKSPGGAVQSARGHSSIYDAVSTQIDISYDPKTELHTIEQKKARDQKPFDSIEIKMKDTGERIEKLNCTEGIAFDLINDTAPNSFMSIRSALLSSVKNNPAIPTSRLLESIGGNRNDASDMLKVLVSENLFDISQGSHNSKLYTLTNKAKLEMGWTK